MLFSAGCATVPDSSPAIVASSNPCLDLPYPSYSHAFNVEVADELADLPQGAALNTVVHDYIATRAAIAACRAVK